MKKSTKSIAGTFALVAPRFSWLESSPARRRRATRKAAPLLSSAGGYEVEVLMDGMPARTFWHEGGELCARSAWGSLHHPREQSHPTSGGGGGLGDGRDVIDGKSGDFSGKRGYLVPAWGQVEIDGWRLSQRQAAAYRFSSVSDSYAARMGSARKRGCDRRGHLPGTRVPPGSPSHLPRGPLSGVRRLPSI